MGDDRRSHPRGDSPGSGESPAFLSEDDPERAWRSFLEAHHVLLYRQVGRVARDPEAARDVAAEVLVRLRGRWDTLLQQYGEAGERRSRFETWIGVVVRNLAIDVLRSWHGRRTLPRAVGRLPAWEQDLYRLLYWDGWTLAEAEEVLRTRGTLPSDREKLFTATQRLHDVLSPAARMPAARELSGPGRAPKDGDAAGPVTPEAPTPARDAPDRILARERLVGALREILSGMSRDEGLLLRMYFLEGVTGAELGMVFGADSRSQIYNRVHTLLTRLRKRVAAAGLDPTAMAELADFDWTNSLGPGDHTTRRPS
jgi:RNA polymerase sigma factor (sigma-70 family)